jgi:acetyltransferase
MNNVARDTPFVPIELRLRDGQRITLRAVQPQDEDRFQAVIKGLSEASRYTRFMSPLRELSGQMLERAVNPDPAHELQLVAVSGEQEIAGGARYCGSAGNNDCEFAITVANKWQGRGLARPLLTELMHAARTRGFEHMEGYILAGNVRMLGLAKRLGFTEVESPEGPMVRMLRCDLRTVA